MSFARLETSFHSASNFGPLKAMATTLQGRVLIVDDVISAGTSVRESVEMIKAAGATPAGVAIAIDRQERGLGELSAVQEVEKNSGMPVIKIATLADLIAFLDGAADLAEFKPAVQAYRNQYGV